MKNYDVIILGAGASGLMCGANLSKELSVAIVEGNEKAAKKLKISGGGKCNITNVDVKPSNFDGEKELIKTVFKKFNKEKLLRFLDRNNIELEIRKNRYYFCKHSSQDIIELLLKLNLENHFYYNHRIISLTKEDELFILKTDKQTLKARNVIVATGGKSFTNLGASDVGLEIAKSFDIKTKDFTPALVGLTVQKDQFWMKELSGLSTYVNIKVKDKVLKEDLLFTHKGLSGPAILSASLYWDKGDISINFTPDEAEELPKRLQIALKDKSLTNYKFAPAGNYGFTKAEVSRGGVLANELEYKSLESKKINGLYFIGEVVDVTGELGGYNFQWAFSSAYVCAKSIKI
ncbi:aminoacetone oxidase family FAD-binding enzyme [Sulfurimonas sp. C5]|uniref:NAD(P)/FAD-dependent oxidoreductase n=1 Tax=Sulfurimonas sp. C5 TaxID=3036947 RepID=UPI002454CB0B|nr:aminoacetone oxidase family FAD-binding enzyme [Sulfurimonas sp. C5]MDH4945208.1 aminoacetone oxidase family FAD-binding enzyme [Sulfurimonas sp. C5]